MKKMECFVCQKKILIKNLIKSDKFHIIRKKNEKSIKMHLIRES